MQKTIIVKDIINSINCYDRDQGELLYIAMSTELKKNNQLEIDFKDIEVITSTFISSSFANLIVCSSAIKFIKENIKVVNIDKFSRKTLNKVLKLKFESIVKSNPCKECSYINCLNHPTE